MAVFDTDEDSDSDTAMTAETTASRGIEFSVPEDATDEETAAIAAAVSAHLARLRAEVEAAESDSEEAWNGDKWAFAGRIESLGGRSVRVPDGAPTDSWSAMGRQTRF